MAEFQFTGTEEREFPYHGLSHALIRPGDVVEADENPDPHWFEPVAADLDEKE
jgi:hypothetical protein